MAHSLYLTVGEPNSGSEQAGRVVLAALQKQYGKVGVFRAFTETKIEEDAAFVALATQAGMTDFSDAYGAKSSDYLRSETRAMQLLIQRYRDFSIGYDAVLILGWLDEDMVRPGLLSLNGRAAANLSAPVLLVVSSDDRDASDVAHMASHELFREHAHVRATIITSPIPALPRQIPSWGPHLNIMLLENPELSDEQQDILIKAIERGSEVVTPIAFTQNLMTKASSRRKRIVLPESNDERILRAASRVLALSVADIILLGDREEIINEGRKLHIDVSGATFVNKDDPEILERYAEEFARLRADKGITLDEARAQVSDESYFAVMMLHMGDADGMVSGA
ncbi:MAG: phosphate acetyltransferase, partial [Actinomycetaceae bacterium]|nr:phosphate acetyltransferase [Actinomycetaceae bacterium]